MNRENEALIDFFLNPKNYPEKVEGVKHIETHISHVFIAGNYVYKIKKPVNFGFLDFTTLHKRRFYCYKEVQLNSRLSKNLYEGIVPLFSSKEGLSLKKAENSKIVEYVIKMKRIDDNTILFNNIQNGRILYNQVDKVAEHISIFHKNADAYTGRMSIYRNTVFSCEENFSQIKPYVNKTIGKRTYNKIVDYTRCFLKMNKKKFYERRRSGFVKEIHGDLHSQHISLGNPPIIFDCIEFNKRFRIDDVLNDISFLLMDLEYNGRYDLSEVVLNIYSHYYKEAIDREFIKFYKIYRAVVRGKVEGFISDTLNDEVKKSKIIKRASDYFSLAETYLDDNTHFNPVIFFGPSGSGKSTIAREFSKSYRIIRSDEVRKIISGKSPDEHIYVEYGKNIYSKDMTKKTYYKMAEMMLENIKNGKKILLDATFLKKWQREIIINVCREGGYNPFFVYFVAPQDLLFARIKMRIKEGKDISDAREEILRKQLCEMEQPDELPSFRLLKLDTSQKKEDILTALKLFL